MFNMIFVYVHCSFNTRNSACSISNSQIVPYINSCCKLCIVCVIINISVLSVCCCVYMNYYSRNHRKTGYRYPLRQTVFLLVPGNIPGIPFNHFWTLRFFLGGGTLHLGGIVSANILKADASKNTFYFDMLVNGIQITFISRML